MTDNLPATMTPEMLALIEEGSKTGVESFSMRQLVVPWLRIVQAGTPFGKRSSPQYIEGCVEGDLIDTLMLKPMKSAVVIPCKFEDHWTEWEHKEDERGNRVQGALIKQWFTDSSKYDNSTGGDPGFPRRTEEGNDINQTPTYYCLLIDPETGMARPVVLPLASTQAKKSARWNSLIDSYVINMGSKVVNAPIYARSYKLTTQPEKSKRNPDPYMGWVIMQGDITLNMPNGVHLWKQAQEVRKAVERGEMYAAPPIREVSEAAPMRADTPRGEARGPVTDADEIPF